MLLVILIVLEVYAASRVSLRFFDSSALLIMSAYTLCMASKSVSLIIFNGETQDIKRGKDMVDIFNMATDIIIQAMMFYFVFEMRSVADIVESITH